MATTSKRKRFLRWLLALLLLSVLAVWGYDAPTGIHWIGSTDSEVTVTVVDDAQRPIEGAQIEVGAVFRRIRSRADLAKDLVVYLTRHEHGTRVCELHGIQAAADALGHSDVKTTSTRYVKKNRRLQRERQEGLFDDDQRRAA